MHSQALAGAHRHMYIYVYLYAFSSPSWGTQTQSRIRKRTQTRTSNRCDSPRVLSSAMRKLPPRIMRHNPPMNITYRLPYR